MTLLFRRCELCGRALTPCPARWDGEDTFVGFYPRAETIRRILAIVEGVQGT